MDRNERINTLFDRAISNLLKDKIGVSIDLLDEILRIDSDNKLALLARGSIYLKLGNSINAISDFSLLLEIDGNHPKALQLRGVAWNLEGSTDKALRDFNRAIDIDPEYGTAYYGRSIVLYKMGQDEKAAKDMKMADRLKNMNFGSCVDNGNIFHSHQLRFEDILELDIT